MIPQTAASKDLLGKCMIFNLDMNPKLSQNSEDGSKRSGFHSPPADSGGAKFLEYCEIISLLNSSEAHMTQKEPARARREQSPSLPPQDSGCCCRASPGCVPVSPHHRENPIPASQHICARLHHCQCTCARPKSLFQPPGEFLHP